jgi:renalase
MNNTTVIIGAGISGLLLARSLAASGATVVVLEKSRGYGGRMATKRVGETLFDQGAQFFTARDPAFVGLVEDWHRQGLVVNWPETHHRRWVGRPSMTAVPKALAEGLEILREHKVTRAHRHASGGWEIDIENEGIMQAARVLFTCPVPQALALLRAGDFSLPGGVAESFQVLSYHPCIALLVVLSGPSLVPVDGVAFNDGPVRWLADNVKKGLAQNTPAALTIHASIQFSEANYGRTEAEIAEMLLPSLEPWLGAPVVSATVHRWKFSEPKTTHSETCVWLPEFGLGFAGDAFGGPKIEGASLSGLALARKVAGCLVPRQ